MPDIRIAEISAFDDPGRKVVDVNGVEIGVFRLGSGFFGGFFIFGHGRKEVKSKKEPERNADKRPRAQFFRGRAPSASSAGNGRSPAPGPGAR